MDEGQRRFYATAAYLSALMTWVGFLTFILFLSFRGMFGSINDVSGMLLSLVQMPVAWAVHRLFRATFPGLSAATFVVGLLGMLLGAIGLGTLVFKRLIPFEFPEPYPGAGAFGFGILGPGLTGLWLILVAVMTFRSGRMGRRPGWLALIAGIGYALVYVGFVSGGVSSPLGIVGGLAALIAAPLWFIAFGRHVAARRDAGAQAASI